MQVFLHTLFLKYATETEGNKCKAAFYMYKQIGMRSLELFWPCTILVKNLGDVKFLPAAFHIKTLRPLRPGLKAPLGLASKALRAC